MTPTNTVQQAGTRRGVTRCAEKERPMTIHRRDFLAGMATVGGASLLHPPPLAARQAQPQARRYSKPVIDAHFHWYPPEFANLIEKEGAANGVTDIKRNANGELECVVPGYHPYAPRA